MHPDARERLSAAIERKNAERGRPLTACEKLDNLAKWIWPEDWEMRAARKMAEGGGSEQRGRPVTDDVRTHRGNGF
jgi:hypothetical protein